MFLCNGVLLLCSSLWQYGQISTLVTDGSRLLLLDRDAQLIRQVNSGLVEHLPNGRSQFDQLYCSSKHRWVMGHGETIVWRTGLREEPDWVGYPGLKRIIAGRVEGESFYCWGEDVFRERQWIYRLGIDGRIKEWRTLGPPTLTGPLAWIGFDRRAHIDTGKGEMASALPKALRERLDPMKSYPIATYENMLYVAIDDSTFMKVSATGSVTQIGCDSPKPTRVLVHHGCVWFINRLGGGWRLRRFRNEELVAKDLPKFGAREAFLIPCEQGVLVVRRLNRRIVVDLVTDAWNVTPILDEVDFGIVLRQSVAYHNGKVWIGSIEGKLISRAIDGLWFVSKNGSQIPNVRLRGLHVPQTVGLGELRNV